MAKSTTKKKQGKPKAKQASYTNLDFSPGFWARKWKEALIIPLLAFGLYWMCLPYGYVLDDQIVITDNQYTKKGIDGIWDILRTESFQGISEASRIWLQGPGTDRYPLYPLPSNNLFLETVPLSGISSISYCMVSWAC